MFTEGNTRFRVLNSQIQNQCTISQVRCLRLSKTKNILFIMLAILTLGFTWLLAYWSATLNRRLRYRYCELARCTHFLFLNWDDVWQIAPRRDKHFMTENGEAVTRISFENRFVRYYYDTEKEVFCTARYQLGEVLDEMAKNRVKLHSEHHRTELMEEFGRNIIEVPVSSRISLFMGEVLSPFQVFQFYAIILWYVEQYYIFPSVLIIASFITYLYNVTLLQQTQQKLKQDSDIRTVVNVLVGQGLKMKVEAKRSDEIVPGDILYLREGEKVPCDCIVLMGSVLVNENYISGDPYPVRKVELHNFVYISEQENQFTLYMGTDIMEIQGSLHNKLDVPVGQEKSVVCLATKTNYYSLRGQYLRSILYPKTHSMQFYTQSIKFLLIIIGITILGFIIVCIRVWKYLPASSMFQTLLDLLTTSIPPTLPTAMSVGIGFAIQRLSSLNIKCSNPQKILVGGEVETVCFEKTGTLTKKDYKVIGFALCEKGVVTGIITKPEEIEGNRYAQAAYELMASCHNVCKSHNQGSLLGKPTDLAMLEFSTGRVTETHNMVELFGKRIQILRRFEFSFALQRNAVLVRTEDGERKLFVKGDPEKVIKCCREQSVPKDIGEYIGNQSQKGFKILALSARSIPDPSQPTQTLKKLQRDMLFLGVLIFQNPILTSGSEAVRTLLQSNVHTVVLSGDNQLTSGAIAFGCGMLDSEDLLYCDLQVAGRGKKRIVVRSRDSLSENRDVIGSMGVYVPEDGVESNQQIVHEVKGNDEEWIKEFLFSLDQQKQVNYGMTGRLFEELFMKRNAKSLQPMFSKTILFSRMLPKHKVGLFQHYQNIGQVCAFVGQNSRQASGFRHADLSLALTQGQVSSFSHFSSLRQNLNSIIDLLRVCRAGLSTNFQTFKMMCQFSLMQFTTMIILYLNYEDLTQSEYLYVDLFIMCPIFITLSMTEPCDRLSKFKPPASLFSKVHLLSMLGLFVIQLLGQMWIVGMLKAQTFYTERMDHKRGLLKDTGEYNQGMLLSSTLFIFTNFLYMGVVIATSISKPFRKDFYTNPYLVANVLLLTVYNFAIAFTPQLVPDSMKVDQSNPDWYVFVAFWANILCLVMYVYERVLVWFMERIGTEGRR